MHIETIVPVLPLIAGVNRQFADGPTSPETISGVGNFGIRTRLKIGD